MSLVVVSDTPQHISSIPTYKREVASRTASFPFAEFSYISFLLSYIFKPEAIIAAQSSNKHDEISSPSDDCIDAFNPRRCIRAGL
jgi:hypothetical protein